MDATLQALIAASKAEFDDTPRLVLADWLEENGEEARGQLIRVQCELAREDEDRVRREVLQRQEQELLHEHSLAWLGPLAQLPGEWSFQRGFVVYRFNAKDFLDKADQARQWDSNASWIERIQPLQVSPDQLQALLAHALFAGTSSVNLSEWNPRTRHLQILSRSKNPPNLNSLDLHNCQLDAAATGWLAESEPLARLAKLELGMNNLCAAGTQAIHGNFAIKSGLWFSSAVASSPLRASGPLTGVGLCP